MWWSDSAIDNQSKIFVHVCIVEGWKRLSNLLTLQQAIEGSHVDNLTKVIVESLLLYGGVVFLDLIGWMQLKLWNNNTMLQLLASRLKILWMSLVWFILNFWCNLKVRISSCLNFPFWNHIIVLACKLAQNNCLSHPWLMKHYWCIGHLCSCFLCLLIAMLPWVLL